MSILPRCTCDRFGSMFGEYDERCARHWSSAKWWKQKMEQRAADLENLRKQALTRPVHGGYPDADAKSPLAR